MEKYQQRSDMYVYYFWRKKKETKYIYYLLEKHHTHTHRHQNIWNWKDTLWKKIKKKKSNKERVEKIEFSLDEIIKFKD